MKNNLLKKSMAILMTLAMVIGLLPAMTITASAAAGDTWTVQASIGADLKGVCYGNSTFVAVGAGGTILTSSYGTSWTNRTVGGDDLNAVCYGNGMFMAVGTGGKVITSLDGATWTARTNTTAGDLIAVAYGNGVFVALAKVEGIAGYIYTSTNDGVSWDNTHTSNGYYLNGICFGNSQFVVVGDSDGDTGIVLTSSDGNVWVDHSTNQAAQSFTSVCYGNGKYVACDIESRVLTSIDDGINWVNLNWRDASHRSFDAVCYGGTTYVTVGSGGVVYTSPDGNSWTSKTSNTPNNLRSVCYGNDTFVAVGDSGTIITSSGVVLPTVTLSVNNSTISENGIATVAATLSATSSSNVTVTLGYTGTATSGGTDYTASSTTITIPAGSTMGTATITAVNDTLDEADETAIVDITGVTNGTESGTQQVSVTITDDDAAPTISVNDPSVAESNSGTTTLSFTVTLSAASGKTVTVNYATSNNTATAGTDYTATSGTLTFNPGQTSKTISVTVAGDSGYEPDESFYIDLTNPSNATISDAQGVGTITNDDAPTVTLSVNNASVAENGGVATVTATLSAASVSNVTVTLGYTGTATSGGTDYTASSTTITISAGSTTGTATITAVNDALDENNETAIIDITDVTNGTESGTQQVTVTITDDDAAPTISVNDPSVAEGNSGTTTLSFTVTLSAASGKTVTVDYATANGTATAGTDYTATSGTLTFNAGETSKTVSLTVAGDTITETDETALLNLSNASNATISDNQGSGTITNDDANPVISVNDASVAEGNSGTSTLNFTVSLDHATTSTITVDYATANNTATAGTDYTTIGATTLTFDPGDTSKTVSVTISGDVGYEPDESFYINLTNQTNASLSDAQGVGTITNDDAAPTVTLSVNNASVTENGGVATVTATLSAASVSDVTVTIGCTGTATGGGTDYAASSTTITITAGSTTGTATITAASDALDEVDETVIVDITGVTNGTESGTQQVTVTITDDDAAPTISVNDPSVAEGNSGTKTLSFTVTLSAASGKTVTVDYATANGTATAGTDYTAKSGTLTFAAGETSKTVDVTVSGDTVTEPDEAVLLNLSNAGNAAIADNQGSGTITNDDAVPGISVNDVSVGEGNAGTSTLTFTFSLDHASASTVTVDYATENNTATAGSDYTTIGATTLTFDPGDTSKTVSVTISGDVGYEPDESFYIDLTNPSNATIGDAQGIGTITNDDAAPTVTLSVNNASVAENGGVATVTATLSAASVSNVTVTLGYTGTATSGGTDYTASSTTITISAGSTTGTATITAVNDALNENNETAIIDITDVTNGTESGTQQVTVTITDDDAAPTISVNDPSVAEGNSGTTTLSFTVTLSAASGKTVTVDYATVNGTATAGTDYTSTSGTLTFAVGETSKQIAVVITGDTNQESGETVLLNLSNSVNATITDSQGSGTITDDDTPLPAATSTNSAVVEVNGQKQDAGSSQTATIGGQTVTTITVDDTKLNKILDGGEKKQIVTLPTSGKSDVTVGELSGQTIKNMENKEATLEIKTDSVTYTLPASEINIDDVSAQLGTQVALKDIKVSVSIAEPSADTVKIVEDTANKGNYQLVVKPVEFTITCTSGDKTVDVSKFNGYVERTVAIPDGIDPSKITTGIVLNADGTFSHVPTTIVKINGKYYAKINSLTNSTYSVIYNPMTFTDVSNHWAKDAINDMGSRMVVTGVGNSAYEPDRSITRAEFAAVVVRALGLQKGKTESSFADVTLTDWFNGYVDTATAYSLITGYDSASYGPNDTITREQAMAIIARAMKLTDLSVSLTDSELSTLLAKYTDGASVSSYAKASAAVCLKTGIVTGSSATTISPVDYITRAEVAVMVQRMLQKSGLI